MRAAARIELLRRADAKELLREKMNGFYRPEMPPAYEFLFEPARYKVAKGGRGKGASWNIARKLIYKAHCQSSLILCTREYQNSIADSVHRVIATQIAELGYGEFFEINQRTIKSKISKSEFIFRGLNDLTADTVRSMEGITDVWVAEAETMGARSWQVLDPTIRKDGSEIYVDYNPENEQSPTNVMFASNPPDDAIVRHLTFSDNPFFPSVLEKQRQNALKRIEVAPNEDAREQAQMDYNHVWLGMCKKINKASIFGANYIVEEFTPDAGSREWDGPYDGADWGFSQDPSVRVRLWVHTRIDGKKRLCIEREAYGVGVELNDLPAMFDVFPDSRKIKIRADNARPETISFMKNAGFNIIAADKWKGSVEDGIAHMKGAYHQIVCHPRCKYTEEELRLYSYKTDRLTGDVTTDIIDANNHVMDSCRYSLDPLIKRKKGAHLFG